MDKVFYVTLMYGKDGVDWSTKNFTDDELKVIERFLKELNTHIEGESVDCITILDNDED